MLNSDVRPVAAKPSPIVTAITATRKGAGHRVTARPSSSATGVIPGNAFEIARGEAKVPRDSRRWSIFHASHRRWRAPEGERNAGTPRRRRAGYPRGQHNRDDQENDERDVWADRDQPAQPAEHLTRDIGL